MLDSMEIENTNPFVWTKERCEFVIENYGKEEWPIKLIARSLGTSENAVIGKAHRLGLTAKKKTVACTPAYVNQLEKGGHFCRYMIGHIGEVDAHFCGDPPVADKPYCGYHAAKCYIRRSEKCDGV